ncbi:hypothetical protein B0E51_18510 [Rhodanobacter sp. C05]|nr:hypothetical protein B0E51_18510 [Rhodanobacter sp. C05]
MMHIGKVAGCAFVAAAASLLSGCVQNAVRPVNQSLVPVKTIMQDLDGYSSREFTPATLPDQVQKTIVNSDGQSVGFHRLIVDLATNSTQNGGTGVSHYTSHDVYQNEGNGLVRGVSTISSNGIQTMVVLGLIYRNIYSVRAQSLSLSAVNANRIVESRTISHFDTPATGHELHLSYDTGYVGQTTNLLHNETNCVFGRSFEASEINPKIMGTARDLDCQVSNQNGIVISKERRGYLDKYGFAILLRRENSTADITFTVTDFKTE